MAESFFDIVSKIDQQEVDNALNQAAKEIAPASTSAGSGRPSPGPGTGVEIRANSEERAKAVLDVFKDKLVRRGVSLKALDPGEPKPSGKEYRLGVGLKEGISQDDARKISKLIRDEGPEGRPGPGAGRGTARVLEEEGRPAGRDRPGEGQRLRPRAAVRQLPLGQRRARTSRCHTAAPLVSPATAGPGAGAGRLRLPGQRRARVVRGRRRNGPHPVPQPVALVGQPRDAGLGVAELRRPEQRVVRDRPRRRSRSTCTARSRWRTGQHVAHLGPPRRGARAGAAPPVTARRIRPARVPCVTRCRCTSPGTPARTACRPCSSPPAADDAAAARGQGGAAQRAGASLAVPCLAHHRSPDSASSTHGLAAGHGGGQPSGTPGGTSRRLARGTSRSPGSLAPGHSWAARAASAKSLRNGMSLEPVRQQQRCQAGMPVEDHTEHLVRLALVPGRAPEQAGGCGQHRRRARDAGCAPAGGAARQRVQVDDHGETPVLLVHRGQPVEEIAVRPSRAKASAASQSSGATSRVTPRSWSASHRTAGGRLPATAAMISSGVTALPPGSRAVTGRAAALPGGAGSRGHRHRQG